MQFILSLLGLSTQVPLHFLQGGNVTGSTMMSKPRFALKEGPEIFSPKDLGELARPGAGVANAPGDLVMVPVSKYSFDDKKYVHRAL